VDYASHDGLCEDMKKVCANGKNAFDAGAHQGRGNNKTSSRPDAACNQAGAEAYED